VFYKWRQRYDQHGLDGLRDRSRGPRVCPNQTRTEVVGKIIYLRQHYHFGPAKIAMYLQRYHDIQISHSGVWRVPEAPRPQPAAGLPALQAPRPALEALWAGRCPAIGCSWTCRFIAPLAGSRRKHYQFTAIDDCTRLRVLRIYPQLNQKTAIQFVDYVLERLPFRVEVIQTDNGAEFQSHFHWHLEDLDIQHAYIRPRTPHLNGKVERSHRVDDQKFYQLLDRNGVTDDIHLFNTKLREWEDYYNYHRPHGALDGQTPYERLLAKTRAGASPAWWEATQRDGLDSNVDRRNVCQLQ
jgi:transposase InsO family protein